MRVLNTVAAIVAILVAVTVAPAWAEKRVALVIGNNAYQDASFPTLANPVNDAEAISERLTELGFQTELVPNASKDAMEDALGRFSRTADGADIVLVYFAGHGLQDQGKTYLAPIDARLDHETDLRRRFVRLDDLMDDLSVSTGVRIILLDACRNNDAVAVLRSILPKTRASGLSRGLARAPAAEGHLIGYATQPDAVADDGAGRHSPYAAALLAHLGAPGVELRTTLTRVRRDVAAATGNMQVPEVSDSALGEIYLGSTPADALAADEAAWRRIAGSADADDFEGFAAFFPDSPHAAEARERAAGLRRAAALPADPAVEPAAVEPPPAEPADPASRPAKPVEIGDPSSYRGGIASLAFSPDGQTLLASGYNEYRTLLWGIAGDSKHTLFDVPPRSRGSSLPHLKGVSAAAYSPDGTRIVTGRLDGGAKVWDATNLAGEALATLAIDEPVRAVAFSPDGKRIVTVDELGSTLVVWDADTLERGVAIARPMLRSFAYSPDGARLATAGSDGLIEIRDAATGAVETTIETEAAFNLNAVAFSPDGGAIAVAAGDGGVEIRSADDGRLLRTLAAPGVRSAVFSPDGSLVATVGPELRLFDAEQGSERARSGFLLGDVVAFSPDGSRVAAASSAPDARGTIAVWAVGELLGGGAVAAQ